MGFPCQNHSKQLARLTAHQVFNTSRHPGRGCTLPPHVPGHWSCQTCLLQCPLQREHGGLTASFTLWVGCRGKSSSSQVHPGVSEPCGSRNPGVSLRSDRSASSVVTFRLTDVPDQPIPEKSIIHPEHVRSCFAKECDLPSAWCCNEMKAPVFSGSCAATVHLISRTSEPRNRW